MKNAVVFCSLFFSLVAYGEREATYDVAAYVWPAYHPAERWAELGLFGDGKGEWQNLYEAVKRCQEDYQGIKPLWGYENEADPIVVARKIDAATAAGVNVFIYDWYWYGGRPFLEEALDEGFLKAHNCERMRFYLMYANHDVTGLWNNKVGGEEKNRVIWPAKITDDDWKAIVARWISRYFTKKNYYRIKGCPVLSFYDASAFVHWEGLEKARARIAYLREEVRRAGFPGLHLQIVAGVEDNGWLSPDSVTVYNWLYRTWGAVNGKTRPLLTYRAWGDLAMGVADEMKTICEGLGATYFPNLTIGWDTNSRFPPTETRRLVTKSNPDDFEHFARRVKEWSDRNLPADVPRLVIINSWNEWTEGSCLEPSDRFGYGYLNALWKVFVEPRAITTRSQDHSLTSHFCRPDMHRRAVRQAIAGSVGTAAAESYLTDADPQIRRHALYTVWERAPERGREKANGLREDADKGVSRLAADILDSNRDVSKVFSGVPLSQDRTVDHEILRVRTIVPKGGKFTLPVKIASDAVELWFAETPKTKVVVSLNGVPAYEFDPDIAGGRSFRADVTRTVRWAAENAVRVTDETGAEREFPFEVEVLKCGG